MSQLRLLCIQWLYFKTHFKKCTQYITGAPVEDLEQPAEGNNTVGDNYKECHTLQFNNRNKQKEKMLLCAIHNMILWGQLHLYDNNVQRIHT